MLVFIDDSGDPGFKLDKGSSRFFIISLVIFGDNLEVEKTAVAIKELRRELGFSDEVEFKFFKSRREVREKFLNTINKFDFRVRSLVIDKMVIESDHFKTNKNSFYSYAIKMILKHSNNSILNAKIPSQIINCLCSHYLKFDFFRIPTCSNSQQLYFKKGLYRK